MAVYSFDLTSARIEPVDASSPSTPLRVISATVTFDRTWAPYIQGSLVCDLQTAAEAVATDPRKGLAVKFTLTSSLGKTLPLVAWLRSRVSDIGAGTTTISFASVECLYQDNIDFNGQQWGGTTVYELDDVVSLIMAGVHWVGDTLPNLPVTLDGSPQSSLAVADAGWAPGSSLWDLMRSVEEACGLWLRGDTDGTKLYRMAPTYSPDTSTHVLSDVDRIVSVVDTVNRDNPDWANAAFINYAPDTSGGFRTDYGYLPKAGPMKSVVITRTSRRVKTGAATAIATRMAARGRTLQITAIADLDCRPNMKYRAQFLGYDWTGTVQAVTFRYPEGLMEQALNIIET